MGFDSFYTPEELARLGFKRYGEDVKISRMARFYGAEQMAFGNHVRIDDFCILSGNIQLGSYIHISAGARLFAGKTGILCEDYATISGNTSLYAESDDYSGASMTNPTVPDKYRQLTKSKIILHKHVIVGAHCVILPGVVLAEGTSCGAMSLLRKSTEPWACYAGVPAKKIRFRDRLPLELEAALKAEDGND